MTRNLKKSIAITTILLITVIANCHAYTKYVTMNLNMRYGPGTRYGIINVIPKGTPVTFDEDCDCKWVAVEYGGKIGYISSRYLSSNHITRKASTTRYEKRTGRYNPVPRTSPTPRGHVRYYTNTYGVRVQSPTHYDRRPNGATAICRDGTYSFSQSRRGTCSHHGGVSRWL